jgi:hypothetical protein
MKLTTLLTLAVIAALAPSVLADGPGFPVPDGGATAALLGLGSVGLISARHLFRKK